jgi:preprotein translocase subunit SecY
VLSSVTNIFKVPELRKKIAFTLAMVVLYRLGAHLQVPGIDHLQVKQFQKSAESQGTIGFLNLFSGGALSQFAIFALGIMPYITASIIVQILGVVIPKLEEWQNQGAVGQRKITQWTRYIAMAIALLQATGLTFLFGKGGGATLLGGRGRGLNVVLIPGFPLLRVLLVVFTLTAGTAVLMWMGELITQRGIGNGMSILIFASVVSRLPYDYYRILKEKHFVIFAVLIAISLGTLVAIVFIENGQRRIPVQFAKRVQGRRMYGGQSTYIPLKVNQAGVVPIIFASSVLLLPALLTNLIHADWLQKVIDTYVLDNQNWLHLIIYGFMIVAFAYFYNAIAFDPIKQADQIRKQGGFIPGIRPGRQTESHLSKILNRITLPGALFIAAIALLPSIVLAVAKVNNFPFGGTTVLIAVGVALETMKQIDSQLMLRNYEGFLK